MSKVNYLQSLTPDQEVNAALSTPKILAIYLHVAYGSFRYPSALGQNTKVHSFQNALMHNHIKGNKMLPFVKMLSFLGLGRGYVAICNILTEISSRYITV